MGPGAPGPACGLAERDKGRLTRMKGFRHNGTAEPRGERKTGGDAGLVCEHRSYLQTIRE